MSTITVPHQAIQRSVVHRGERMQQLRDDVVQWWKDESDDWDDAVTQEGPDLPGGTDLWDRMPAIDSKAVARTSPIFERHFGKPLDPKLIRPGGYSSVDDMLDDLVPKMQKTMAS